MSNTKKKNDDFISKTRKESQKKTLERNKD